MYALPGDTTQERKGGGEVDSGAAAGVQQGGQFTAYVSAQPRVGFFIDAGDTSLDSGPNDLIYCLIGLCRFHVPGLCVYDQDLEIGICFLERVDLAF